MPPIITAIGGGTAFAAADEDRTGVRLWIQSSVSEVTLAPGARQSVAFSVTVPSDAAPGDHIAGLIVEAPPKAGQAGGVQTSVVERRRAVVVRVLANRGRLHWAASVITRRPA
jgi:hypothetical protein